MYSAYRLTGVLIPLLLLRVTQVTRSLVDFSTGEQGSDMISTFRYAQSGQWGKYLGIALFNTVQKHQYDRRYFLYIYFDCTALFCFLPNNVKCITFHVWENQVNQFDQKIEIFQ